MPHLDSTPPARPTADVPFLTAEERTTEVRTDEPLEPFHPRPPAPSAEFSTSPPKVNAAPSTKSATTALLLAIFLGGLGLHRFYLGRIGTGLLRLACLPLALVPIVGPLFLAGWWLLDVVLVANRSLRPAPGAVYA